MLRPDTESSAQQGHGRDGVCTEERHKNDLRDGIPALRGQAESAGAVQPEDEKALERPDSGMSVSRGSCRKEGDRLFIRVRCDRTRGNHFKLKERRFRLETKKKCFRIR